MLYLNAGPVIKNDIFRRTYLVFVKKYNLWQVKKGQRNKIINLYPPKKEIKVEESSSDSSSSSDEESDKPSSQLG